MEQLINSLVKAGYVQSVRGAQGGYRLRGEPKITHLGMILRLMEGVSALCPVSTGEENSCLRAELRHGGSVAETERRHRRVVDSVTLEDLVQRRLQRKRGKRLTPVKRIWGLDSPMADEASRQG